MYIINVASRYEILLMPARAALAQSVERRLGKAEVGGSSPLGSLQKTPEFQGFLYNNIIRCRAR